MSEHEPFMQRAIELALQARGRTHPNPMVGCVIVRDGEVVAEGFHLQAGSAHAEVAAIQNLEGSGEGCTLYVTLEPCSNFGRTPPCTNAVQQRGITHVVIGAIDPNPNEQGRGVQILRENGIEVTTGVLEAECQAINAGYNKVMHEGRPLVVAKYAMTLDGKIATREGQSSWISNEQSRAYTHNLRNQYDAIMVGSNTAATDNPRLTCRADGGRNPVRVIVDAELSVPTNSVAYSDDGTRRIVIAHTDADTGVGEELAAQGVDVLRVDGAEGRIDLAQAMRILASKGITSVLVEGGGGLLGGLFDAKLIDRAHVFVAPKLIGGADAVTPMAGLGVSEVNLGAQLTNIRIERFGDDVLIEGDVEGND